MKTGIARVEKFSDNEIGFLFIPDLFLSFQKNYSSIKKVSIMRKKLLIVLISFSFLTVGCATIFSGSTQKVSYSSEPSGAKVYVNGQYLGNTPFELNMRKNKSYTVEFKKEGYRSRTVIINNNVAAGWIVLDVLGGLVPVVIDAATGNWYSLNPDNVRAVLEVQK